MDIRDKLYEAVMDSLNSWEEGIVYDVRHKVPEFDDSKMYAEWNPDFIPEQAAEVKAQQAYVWAIVDSLLAQDPYA